MKTIVASAALTLVAVGLTAASSSVSSAAQKDPLMFAGAVYAEGDDEVELTAHIWPNQQELLDLPVGSYVPTIPVPLELTGNRYAVRLDLADVPAEYRDKNGVEVLVEAFSEGKVDSYGEKLRPAADGGWERNVLVAAQTARASTFRMASGASTAETPGTLTLRTANSVDRRTAAAGLRPATLISAHVAEASGQMAASCRRKWNKTSKTWKRKVKISDVMPAKRHMKGSVRYKSGTSHSIQVAVKVGTAVSGGSNLTVSAAESVIPEPWTGDKVAWTKWRMRRYTHDCSPTYHRARAEKHLGGFTTTTRNRPRYTRCMPYEPMQEWSQARGKAWTYGAGFALWNSSFDTQTGYNTQTELVYNFPNRRRWLCGNNDFPAQAQLIAGYARKQS